MKTKLLMALLFGLLLQGGSAQADTPANDAASPEDEAALLRLMRPYFYTLNKPYYVYSWRPESRPSAIWKSSQDARVYPYVKQASAAYWDVQGDPTHENMYGIGLYTSTDPVATRSYGGCDGTWSLTEIHLPAGSRILDLARDANNPIPLDQNDLITRLGCPESWKATGLFAGLMNPNAYDGHPKCAAAIRKVMKDQLKIDAFTYNYGATSFKECDTSNGTGSYTHQVALVITDSKRLKPADVKIFNAQTNDDDASRQRIESIFAKAQQNGLTLSNCALQNSGTTVPSSVGVTLPLDSLLEKKKKMMQAQHLERYIPWLVNPSSSMTNVDADGHSVSQETYCNKSGYDPAATFATGIAAASTPKGPGIITATPVSKATLYAAHTMRVQSQGSTPPSGGSPATPKNIPAVLDSLGPEFKFDNSLECVTLTFPASLSPDPATRAAADPQATSEVLQMKALGSDGALWPELDGKPITPNLRDWMRKNLYTCVNEPAYRAASEDPSQSQSAPKGTNAGQSGSGTNAK